ncbi:MAG: hypothetical protein A4S17_04110 [Proteobacteria bacterium HN_bin10]|nr:MAG: hypothetical protein A4S17_04110 [Proteobacteria bacterium HN_bin10]
MTLSAFADLAEVIGALGVVAGLVFVGFQLRQNTHQLRRVEANAMNAEASPLRQSIMNNAELAELVSACIAGSRPLNPVERQRLDSVFWEVTFISFQMWDRSKSKYFSAGDFERTIPAFAALFASAFGRAWWQGARTFFRAAFVAELEALIPELKAPLAEPMEAAP